MKGHRITVAGAKGSEKNYRERFSTDVEFIEARNLHLKTQNTSWLRSIKILSTTSEW